MRTFRTASAKKRQRTAALQNQSDFTKRFRLRQPSTAFERCFTFHNIELLVVGIVLIALNWSLFQGICNARLIFLPNAALQGEWWRWFTHPFIHVTWWHLLLDGAAFLMLYRDLQERAWGRRVLLCAGSGVGTLAVCLCADPMLSTRGLCGLSGIAHGLMAVSALDMMQQRHDKFVSRFGIFCFALVTFKCLLEALTGKMFFAFLHFGMVGEPVAVAHAGGLLGALVTSLFYTQYTRRWLTTPICGKIS